MRIHGAGHAQQHALKGEETAIIDQVTLVGNPRDREPAQASIKTRINRNPVIGDKFSSRHGQKGVLSQLWPDTDMPYAEATGMRCAVPCTPRERKQRGASGCSYVSKSTRSARDVGEGTREIEAPKHQVRSCLTCMYRRLALNSCGLAPWGPQTMAEPQI